MKTSGINFRHLYFFRVVAAEGSVTRAADKLHLTQPTLSILGFLVLIYAACAIALRFSAATNEEHALARAAA